MYAPLAVEDGEDREPLATAGAIAERPEGPEGPDHGADMSGAVDHAHRDLLVRPLRVDGRERVDQPAVALVDDQILDARERQVVDVEAIGQSFIAMCSTSIRRVPTSRRAQFTAGNATCAAVRSAQGRRCQPSSKPSASRSGRISSTLSARTSMSWRTSPSRSTPASRS